MKALFKKRLDGIFPSDEEAIKLIRSMPQGALCKVIYDEEEEEERSLSMNALSHVWYNDISKELNEIPSEIKCECKLVYGVPILRAEDEQFRNFYDLAIKKALSYEEKLKAMNYIPVTSIMTKKQMYRYLQDVKKAYEKNHQIQLRCEGEYEKWLAKNKGR